MRLYNQALLRYNDTAKMSATKPTPVIVVKDDETPATTDIMGEVVTTLPKALQEKGRQLVSRLKTTQWNDRGELLHEGMVAPGSNVVDIVHYLLRKLKTSEPIGWQQFGSQMRAANIPMELVGNVARRRHIQQRKQTLTPKQKKVDEYNFPTIGSLSKTRPLSRDRHNMAQPCMGVVIISVVAVIIVVLVILLTTSPQSYHRCPGGAVPRDARDYSNDTTVLNVSEVMAVLLLCEE